MHTKEPWFLFWGADLVAIYDKDPAIHKDAKEIIHWAGFDSATVKEKAIENARRIVACVNACAGISNESLEAGVLDGLAENLDKQKEAIAKLGDG